MMNIVEVWATPTTCCVQGKCCHNSHCCDYYTRLVSVVLKIINGQTRMYCIDQLSTVFDVLEFVVLCNHEQVMVEQKFSFPAVN